MMEFRDNDFLQDVHVDIREFLVATSDSSDHGIDRAVGEVLHLILDKAGIDIVFVSHLRNGGSSATGFEVLCGDAMVRARLDALAPSTQELPPHPRAGSHIHAPVLLAPGELYGTLCCFSPGIDAWQTRRDQARLRHTASLTAARIRADRAPLALTLVALRDGASPRQASRWRD